MVFPCNMASTRNRNTPGDYAREQQSLALRRNYMSYDESSFYGTVQHTYFPGNGLIGMRTASSNLAANACDIESQLRGIGATNLVEPRAPIAPEIHPLKSLNIADRLPMIMPAPFAPQPNQRAMYLN